MVTLKLSRTVYGDTMSNEHSSVQEPYMGRTEYETAERSDLKEPALATARLIMEKLGDESLKHTYMADGTAPEAPDLKLKKRKFTVREIDPQDAELTIDETTISLSRTGRHGATPHGSYHVEISWAVRRDGKLTDSVSTAYHFTLRDDGTVEESKVEEPMLNDLSGDRTAREMTAYDFQSIAKELEKIQERDPADGADFDIKRTNWKI